MQLVEKEENMKKNDVLLKPVEKDSLYLKISDAVYSYIKMNNLQPDDKLPSERDMAAMLQTKTGVAVNISDKPQETAVSGLGYFAEHSKQAAKYVTLMK